jgi:hypothetical protein
MYTLLMYIYLLRLPYLAAPALFTVPLLGSPGNLHCSLVLWQSGISALLMIVMMTFLNLSPIAAMLSWIKGV